MLNVLRMHRDASYQITVDAIAEADLNVCEWSGARNLSKLATIICTPTAYTVTFTTDWPGMTDTGYSTDAIGAQPHAAGTSFTYTQNLGDARLVLRLIDETIPGDAGDPRPSSFEYLDEPLALPAP